MSQRLFIASCVFTREYPRLSQAVQNYIENRHQMPMMRCCVENYKTQFFEEAMPGWMRSDWKAIPPYIHMDGNTTAVYICHNCSAILQEQLPDVPLLSFWELMLADEAFPYPDYSRRRMAVQDCWRAWDNRAEQDAVRALLARMNIDTVELAQNREDTDFCGLSLYEPAPARNLNLAPKRFVAQAEGKFSSHTEEEKMNAMADHCAGIPTGEVAVYCHYCAKGLLAGGKKAIHLAALLFGMA